MRILLYNEIRPEEIPGLEKLTYYLKHDDFRSADVKKLDNTLYCARLNRADRLLFSLYKSGKHTYALILEHIKNHAYEKSRFLKRGVKINEQLIPVTKQMNHSKLATLPYLEQQTSHFHLLDKPIAFDQAQQQIYQLPTPIIIIGTAGSGKTLLLLEKMKNLHGKILYVTHSSYLAQYSQSLYFSNQYSNPRQTTSFLSFQDLLDSISVQPGKPVTYKAFRKWFAKHLKATPIQDAHAVFEEFRGVITGSNIQNAYLSKHAYLSLGIKESIFTGDERHYVYDLFERYLDFLSSTHRYDHNIVSFEFLSRKKGSYDYVIVDEVQDFSITQLQLIIHQLSNPDHFLLCGDSNQIVYPNFFSWSKIKSHFLKSQLNSPRKTTPLTQILNTNYRNSTQVIEVSNKLLRLKNWRFGSIDKDSHYEMESTGVSTGRINFLSTNNKTLKDINQKTYTSKKYAVIVLYDEMKAVAAEYFHTPLIFSIKECKGLEYENIILFNLVSCASQSFKEISQGVTASILNDPIRYARNKNKADKSLEKYKFFVNALFVAITRTQTNLFWIEDDIRHPLLRLLNPATSHDSTVHINHHSSSQAEWQLEASKLEQQGKSDQAQHIRDAILKQKEPPWKVIAGEKIDDLFYAALEQGDKKAKLALFEYALIYEDHQARNSLIEIGFKPALHPEDGMKKLLIKHFMMYQQEQLDAIQRLMAKYGVNFRNPFNQTPLMIGAWLGNERIIQLANSLNADPFLANNKGFNAFQIALEQACLHNYYASEKLENVYTLLKPDTLSIRINNQLIKLGHHQVEFFLIHLMIALFYRILPENMVLSSGAYNADNIIRAINHWPQSLLPKELHNPSFINEVLSRNQVSHPNCHSPFFIEVSTGNYLLNPDIMLRAEGEWLYVYDILLFDDLAIGYQDVQPELDANSFYKNLLHNKIIGYKHLLGI